MEIDIALILRELYDAEEAENRYDDAAASLLFDPPIFAVADAVDPWFEKLKTVIGPWHWTPAEAFRLAGIARAPARVIVWSLPIAETPRRTSRGETLLPSREWAYARTNSDPIMRRMTQRIEGRLRALGHAALGPAQAGLKPPAAHPPLNTCWSQRHVGFVAGLGTFGISGGLITRRGIAQRMGSVVTDAPVAATPRAYGDDPFAWCLMSARGTCGACIARCPVGSVGRSAAERNRQACADHRETVRARAVERYGWMSEHYGCGLCQTGVPCETRNPTE